MTKDFENGFKEGYKKAMQTIQEECNFHSELIDDFFDKFESKEKK